MGMHGRRPTSRSPARQSPAARVARATATAMMTTKATRTRTSATRASVTVPKAAIRATRTTVTGRTTRTAGLPATRDVETTSAKQHHGRSLGDLPTLHRVGPGDDHGGVAVSSASVDRVAGRGCSRLRGYLQSAGRVDGTAWHQAHLRAL